MDLEKGLAKSQVFIDYTPPGWKRPVKGPRLLHILILCGVVALLLVMWIIRGLLVSARTRHHVAAFNAPAAPNTTGVAATLASTAIPESLPAASRAPSQADLQDSKLKALKELITEDLKGSRGTENMHSPTYFQRRYESRRTQLYAVRTVEAVILILVAVSAALVCLVGYHTYIRIRLACL